MIRISAYIRKDIKEGLRSHKFMIIGAAVLLFAMLNPVMIKILPTIMKGQMPGIDLNELIKTDEVTMMSSTYDDLFQIIPIVVAFVLSGFAVKEYREKSLEIPLSKGAGRKSMLWSKIGVYSVFTAAIIMIADILSQLYAMMLFNYDKIHIMANIRSSLILWLMFLLLIQLLAFFDLRLKKGSATAPILTLATFYGLSIANSLIPADYRKFNPMSLYGQMKRFSSDFTSSDLTTIAVMLGVLLVLGLINHVSIGKKYLD